jgi:adenylate cyclase
LPPKLVYYLGGRQIVYPLDTDEVTIGRSTHNDIVIDQSTVSRKHARLKSQGKDWRVTDLGSTYGTRINDGDSTDAVLKDGDKIFLHRFPLTFVDRAAEVQGDISMHSVPGASLIMPAAEQSDGVETHAVYQETVNFSSLAAMSADVEHLKKLLSVVTKASETILVSHSLDDTFKKVLDLVFQYMPVQRGFIMLYDDARQNLVARCVRHREEQPGGQSEIEFSRTIAEKVCREKVAVLTTDAQADGRFAQGQSILTLGIRSAMAAPLWSGDQVDGLIYADTTLRAKAFDKFDIDLLSALGNQIAFAIEQHRLQESVMEQELARRRLERYHSPAVVERITTARVGDTLMVDEREATVLFADVVGFTDRCTNLEPREIADLLNHYFGEMAEAIFRHEGTLDKFIGDCVMAVFGAPLAIHDHARRAVEAALDMRTALRELNEPLPVDERLRFRVGIHSGVVVAGDIGSPSRRDYTVLGSTVNTAARIESTIAEPDQIVISEDTLAALPRRYETQSVGEHQPKGLPRAIRCHRVVGRRADTGV